MELLPGKAATPQGPPVYSRSGLASLVEKQLNGREVRSSSTRSQELNAHISLTSDKEFRLHSPGLSSSGGGSGDYVSSGIRN